MEGLFAFIWFLLVLAIPLAFVVTAYISFVNGRNLLFVVPVFVGAIFVHVLLAFATMTAMFIIVFAGAHASEPTRGTDTSAVIIAFTIDIGFGIFAWLMCSAIRGKFIGPRSVNE